MAIVQLADIIQPEFFAACMAEDSVTSTALFQSGVLVPNSLMGSPAMTTPGFGDGRVQLSFWPRWPMESTVRRQASTAGSFCKYAVFIIKVLFRLLGLFGSVVCNPVDLLIL
jgi:hypothetical protein